MKRVYAITLQLVLLAGCDQTGHDYFPVAAGMQREYVIEEQINNERYILKSIVTNLAPLTVAGTVYYPQRYASGETWYFRKTGDGIFVAPAPEQAGKIFLAFPLEIGNTWQAETRVDILHRRHESFSGGESFISPDQKILLDFHVAGVDDTVSVPAGRFTGCLRIDGSGSVRVEARTRGIERILIEQSDWYASGVGLVKRVRTEKSIPEKYRGSLVQELVSN